MQAWKYAEDDRLLNRVIMQTCQRFPVKVVLHYQAWLKALEKERQVQVAIKYQRLFCLTLNRFQRHLRLKLNHSLKCLDRRS